MRNLVVALPLSIILAVAFLYSQNLRAGLQVGIATADLTPQIDAKHPVWMAGFARARQARSIDAPLLASAIVFSQQGKSLGLVSIDSIGLGFSDIAVIRQSLQKQNIVDNLIVASTHSHQSPDVIGIWGQDAASPGWNDDYIAHLIQQTIAAVKEAKKKQTPAQLKFKRLDFPLEDKLMFDFRPPEVKDPGVVLLQALQGDRSLGLVVVWSNHPEAMGEENTALSPDYPAYLRQALHEAGYGSTIFMVGAIGGLLSPGTDQAIPDNQGRLITKKGQARAQAIGQHLAQRIGQAIQQNELPPLKVNNMKFAEKPLAIPLSNTSFEQAIAQGLLRGHEVKDKKILTRVSLMQLGDIFFIGVPGEIFPEIIWGGIPRSKFTDFPDGTREEPPLAKVLEPEKLVVIGLADDELGYIIPKTSWDTRPPNFLGEKKLFYGEENSIGPEAAPMIHQALLELIKKLSPSTEPETLPQSSSSSR
ncbi:MAG: hypothetical protein ACOH5I_09560 [Oligoflexus sp.]